MPKVIGNQRFIFTGLGCLLGSLCLWAAFSPKRPYLPNYADNDLVPADYHAGGANCSLEVLSRLAGKEGASERERCAVAAEQHRLDTNDLVQQTRAADAAQASAFAAYEANRITLAGLIGGFLTLVAATFAAYYARRAYLETRRSADLQEMSVNLHSRPFLYLDAVKVEGSPNRKIVSFHIKNIGGSPAFNIRVESYAIFQLSAVYTSNAPYLGEVIEIPVIPPHVVRQFFCAVEQRDCPDELEAISHLRQLWVGIRLTFDTRLRTDKVIEEHRFGRLSASGDDTFYINTRRDDPGEPDFWPDCNDDYDKLERN